jgi:hypothetical protein
MLAVLLVRVLVRRVLRISHRRDQLRYSRPELRRQHRERLPLGVLHTAGAALPGPALSGAEGGQFGGVVFDRVVQ